jgi:glycerol-3-phosphate acyltransferase PlsY
MDANDLMVLGLAALVGYGFGAINPASIIAKARGIDLTDVGSGNPGATNAARAMGKKLGIVVGLLDFLKGLIPALLFARYSVGAAEVAGFAAVVGHITSPFLRGRGGKGVATTLGAVLGAQPLWVPFILVAFGVGFLVTRRVGLGAVLSAIVLLVAALLADELSATLFGLGLAVLVLVRHRKNMAEAWRDWSERAG